jgi:hypothetical protein
MKGLFSVCYLAAVALVANGLFPGLVIAQSKASVSQLEEIRNQVKQGWIALQRQDESSRAYVVTRSSAPTTAAVWKAETVMRVRVNEQFLLEAFTQNAAPDVEVVFARNPSYSFLTKKKQSEKGWVLGRYTAGGDPDTDKVLAETFTYPNLLYCYPVSSVRGLRPAKLLGDSGFSIVNAVPLDGGRYKLDFTHDVISTAMPAKTGKRGTPLKLVGSLIVDPALNWCVVKAEQTRQDGSANMSLEREVEGNGSRLFCKRIVETFPQGDMMEWKFADYSFSDNHNDREFYLSTYGFPEPVGVTPPLAASRTYLWLMSAALACIVCSLVLRWIIRRRHILPLA